MDRSILECFPSGKVFKDLGILRQIPSDPETTCCTTKLSTFKNRRSWKGFFACTLQVLVDGERSGPVLYNPAGRGRVLQKTD